MNHSVIWAIDPFQARPPGRSAARPDANVLKEFFLWMRTCELAIQPVHIVSLSSGEEQISLEASGDGSDRLRTAEEAATKYLEGLGIASFAQILPPKAVMASGRTRGAEVHALLALAEECDSPMIAVSSRGRSGLERLAMGSFAERLLLESKRPVLFLTHRGSQSFAPIRKVLFPADLTRKSRTAFREFLPQAMALRAEILLLHAIVVPSALFSPAGIYGFASGVPEDYFEDLSNWAKKESAHWAREARASGVQVRVIIRDEGVSSRIAPAILEVAREQQVDLIAMASVSGAFSSLVAGSVAREIFRAQEYPVWVWGPKAISKETRLAA